MKKTDKLPHQHLSPEEKAVAFDKFTEMLSHSEALDPKARAAAHEAWTEHGDSLSDDALDTALRAYLAALSASLHVRTS